MKNPLIDVSIAQTTELAFNDINSGILKTFAKREKIFDTEIDVEIVM